MKKLEVTEIGIHEDWDVGGYFVRAYLANGSTLDVSGGWDEGDEITDGDAMTAVELEYDHIDVPEDCPVRRW